VAAKPKVATRRKPSARAEPTLAFAEVGEWKAWLRAHHATSKGVLLRLPKGTDKVFTYAEALDAALAWGWIDSQKRALDETAWLQRFTPRGPKSPWSRINCTRAEALIEKKKMRAPGLAQVERARADGRWANAYHGARASTVPRDLARALASKPRAQRFFATLDGANRYAILYRLQTAKRPETRAQRLERFVSMCARHEVIHARRAAKK
jgi:uncharacterized protein YdeI (YjbR/CyaY-like superfamily)